MAASRTEPSRVEMPRGFASSRPYWMTEFASRWTARRGEEENGRAAIRFTPPGGSEGSVDSSSILRTGQLDDYR
jgi:hypothetical protein